ncbi:ankyrin repeat domain-containing protein 7-like [Schistocerca piceifrons]|uniref:ankyrin repeat domain-containing protein 7-like n=1 Tax=Schistocerca piceifrons TaxID=274613 RepID=UPI001F5F5B37|nr:ankyrin repeat domain-containing protein 7-like [Schistocerca piceifrons]
MRFRGVLIFFVGSVVCYLRISELDKFDRMMKKVLKFVKGKKDERKDYAPSNIGFSTGDQYAKLPVSRPTEEASTTIEHACGYSVDINGKDKSLTKLHKVTWQGNLEKVKAAVKKTDIDIRDRSNRTALHLAAARGHANVVYFLVNNKANVNIRDSDGKVPLLKV